MNYLEEDPSITDIEKTIGQIDGIEAARIVANGNGIEEIHILSIPKRNVKQIARDVESALIAKHGLAVDYRKISIAQVEPPEEKTIITERLKLKTLTVETSGLICRINVNLNYNEKDFEGTAQGSISITNRRKLVAEATLKAVEKASSNVHFGLEGCEIVNFGSNSATCVCVSIMNNNSTFTFSGSALKVEGQENESIVKAVLSSINRKFSTL